MDNYNKAYKEVSEILSHMPNELCSKIDSKVISMIESEKDDSYEFRIDSYENFSNVQIMPETEAIMINFLRDYCSDSVMKSLLEKKQKESLLKEEEEKRLKYGSSDIFKNKKKDIKREEPVPTLPIEVKENIFEKIVNWFKEKLGFFNN